MKKKTTKHQSRKVSGKKARGKSRKEVVDGVTTPVSMQSSLTSGVIIAPPDDNPALTGGQSGDLQGISSIAEADPESVQELLEDGQAMEAEVVSGVEDARDEKEVPARGRLEDDDIPHSFEERNKI
jgi:hypothetical protein